MKESLTFPQPESVNKQSKMEAKMKCTCAEVVNLSKNSALNNKNKFPI